MVIFWHKFNEKAQIPSKAHDAAGFDIYTTEDFISIAPHSQHLCATGLGVAPEEGYWMMAFDRGSTGSKGMHVHCGVIDNDYRGEVFICIKNDNDYRVIITRAVDKAYFDQIDQTFYYPACKAIAQLIPVKQPHTTCYEAGDHEWEILKEKSERKDGKLGSSGK